MQGGVGLEDPGGDGPWGLTLRQGPALPPRHLLVRASSSLAQTLCNFT